MYVAALRDYLRSLALPLKASGASASLVNDIEATCDGMEPFAEMKFAEFAAFLVQAQGYRASGEWPGVSKRAASTSKPRTAKAPAMGVEEALALVHRLMEQAADPGTTGAALEAELQPLDAMTADPLKKVATELRLPKPATKPKALEAIRGLVTSRKRMHDQNRPIEA